MELSRKRILFVFSILLLSFIIFLFTAIKLQIFPDQRIVDQAKKQYTRKIELAPKRGNILDRNGNPLAVSVDLDSIFVDPSLIPVAERPDLSKKLSQALGLEQDVVLKKMNEQKRFVWIKRFLSFDESANIKELVKHEGIDVIKEPKRVYPNGYLASHVIGFVNRDAEGKDGVERYYDDFIKSQNVSEKYERDRKGRVIYVGSNAFISTDNGRTVYLTIDSNIQYQVERELKRVVEEKDATSGTVIVMDPHNGDILALANYPTYDPNDLSKTNNFDMRNRAVTDVFEPGSIFKIVTVGIALINKVMSLKDTLWGENGKFVVVSGKKPIIIKESKNHDYGFMDLKKLISVSSNIGSAKLSLMIGKDKFEQGINKFGFGKRTEIDLPGEVIGLYPKRVGKVELANMGFGQGISVTPMQMVKSYAVIANGGYDVIPHVVDNIKDEKGKTIYEYDYEKEDKVVPTDITKELTSMLRSVVEEGTGTSTNIQGFEIVGKTGTAQKHIPGQSGYSKDKYASSFAGFFPESDPKYAMLVIIDEPKKGSYYGGSVAGPLFRKIANIIVQGTDTKIPLNDKKEEKKKHFEEEYKEQTYREKDVVVEKGTVPDLKGRSLRDALRMISADFKEVKVNGNGRVVRQEPQSGPKPEGQDTITLWLE